MRASFISFFNNLKLNIGWRGSVFAGLLFILLLLAASFINEALSGYNANEQGDLIHERYLPPGAQHFFGTDKFGRDILSRVLYGARISLLIALSVVGLSAGIGLIYGAAAAYLGGRTETVLMRLLDFLMAFPLIFLLLAIISIFQMNHWRLIPILGLTGWMETARLVHAEVLSLRERDFILAAKGFGFSNRRIIFNHIIPNCLTVIFVTAPLKVGEVILLESALSFLGIGIQPPTPSWGSIINDGREALRTAWWVSTFPGIFITLAVISFHLIGEGLKDRLRAGR